MLELHFLRKSINSYFPSFGSTYHSISSRSSTSSIPRCIPRPSTFMKPLCLLLLGLLYYPSLNALHPRTMEGLLSNPLLQPGMLCRGGMLFNPLPVVNNLHTLWPKPVALYTSWMNRVRWVLLYTYRDGLPNRYRYEWDSIAGTLDAAYLPSPYGFTYGRTFNNTCLRHGVEVS